MHPDGSKSQSLVHLKVPPIKLVKSVHFLTLPNTDIPPFRSQSSPLSSSPSPQIPGLSPTEQDVKSNKQLRHPRSPSV